MTAIRPKLEDFGYPKDEFFQGGEERYKEAMEKYREGMPDFASMCYKFNGCKVNGVVVTCSNWDKCPCNPMQVGMEECWTMFSEQNKALVEERNALKAESMLLREAMGNVKRNTDKMLKYSRDENKALVEERDKLKAHMQKITEAFQEYADRRKDKGSATMKIRTWNSLSFEVDDSKKLLASISAKQK